MFLLFKFPCALHNFFLVKSTLVVSTEEQITQKILDILSTLGCTTLTKHPTFFAHYKPLNIRTEVNEHDLSNTPHAHSLLGTLLAVFAESWKLELV